MSDCDGWKGREFALRLRQRPVHHRLTAESGAGRYDKEPFTSVPDLLLGVTVTGHQSLGILSGQWAAAEDAAKCFCGVVGIVQAFLID